MRIAIPKERRAGELRVAASPETVKKLVQLGCEVAVEKGAGAGAALADDAYKDVGATIAMDAASAIKGAQMVLKVRSPEAAERKHLAKDQVLIAILDPLRATADVKALAKAGVQSFAMDLMPRITRAQSMDVLSSQANLAGYKAVLDAAAEFGRAFPLMMTAAGKIAPAQVLVMGAGVAGLQAIATARRLGGVVHATDVRPAAKEQVESLGGKFVAVEDEEFKQAETAGGYAKEMSDAYKKKQAELTASTIAKMDIVITTALIPGRPAPKLIDEAMVKSMRQGSVIVDLAVETGGNCALSQAGKVVTKHGVKILGHENMPSRLATDTSQLYARNVLNFAQLMIDKESKALSIDLEDEIIKGTLVTQGGKIVHPMLASVEADKEEAEEAPKKAPAKKAPAKKKAAPAKSEEPKPEAGESDQADKSDKESEA
ncbi:MAG: Re/Si-specific NAD(P)(+) transhydrogenase subunit alpha [Pseudomonadota bacterium]